MCVCVSPVALSVLAWKYLDCGWLSGQLALDKVGKQFSKPLRAVRMRWMLVAVWRHGLVHLRLRKGSLLLLDAARLYILDVH